MIGKEKKSKMGGEWNPSRFLEAKPEKIRDVRLKAKDKQLTKFKKQLEGFLKESSLAVERWRNYGKMAKVKILLCEKEFWGVFGAGGDRCEIAGDNWEACESWRRLNGWRESRTDEITWRLWWGGKQAREAQVVKECVEATQLERVRLADAGENLAKGNSG